MSAKFLKSLVGEVNPSMEKVHKNRFFVIASLSHLTLHMYYCFNKSTTHRYLPLLALLFVTFYNNIQAI